MGIGDLIDPQQDDQTVIPPDQQGQRNLVMRPVAKPTDISAPASARPRIDMPVSPDSKLDLSSPSPSRNQISGVPIQRPDISGSVPGTQKINPSTGEYQETPYNYQQRLNPMLGVFAHSENIGNPALRTLSRIASGIGTVAQSAIDGARPDLRKSREEEIAASDKEAQDRQEMGIKDADEKRKLGEESLISDSQGNVVGYKEGGQIKSIETAPPELQQIAQASKPKGGWNIKDVNILGEDGKPQTVSVRVNESKMNKLMDSPEYAKLGSAAERDSYLESNGAIERMNLGQTAPSASSQKPQYKMVPTGNGMEQLALMNSADPTKPTMIGQPTRIGTTQLLTMVNPNDPNDVQFFQRDSKTGGTSPVSGLPNGMVTTQAASGIRHEADVFNKSYVDPAMAVEKSYDMMDQAFKEYEDAKKQGKDLPTGAQSMLALSTHLSTTFGNVKGSRITKDMIEHHLGARSVSDNALVAIQKLTNGDVLSPDQWTAFHDLIGQSRQFQWQNVLEEGARRHTQIDPTWVQRAGVRTGKLDGQQVFQINGRVFDLSGNEHTGKE